MIYNVTHVEARQASNGNWYVVVNASPKDDPWGEETTVVLWCSEERAQALAANPPKTIDLEKVVVKVKPYYWVDTETGKIRSNLCDKLTVTVRCHKGQFMEDPEKKAMSRRQQLLDKGEICEAEGTFDEFAGTTSSDVIPE